MPSTLDRLSYEAGQLLTFLGTLTSAKSGPAALLNSLGWDLPPGAQDLGFAALDMSNLAQKLDALDQGLSEGGSDAVLAAQFAEVFLELQRAIAHLRATIAGLSAAGDYLDKTQIKTQVFGRLSSLMVASRIGTISPLAFVLLQFFGVITMRRFSADPSIYQVDHVRVGLDWGALTKLFTDPLGLLKSRYGWGTATFDARGFIVNLNAVVEVLGEPSRVRQLPRRVEEQLSGRSIPEADSNPAGQVIGNFVRGDQSGGFEAGVSLFPLRPTTANGADGGIAVCPFVYGSGEVQFPLSAALTLEFQSTVALDSGVALQFRPGHDMSIKAGLLTDSIEDHATGTALISLTWAAPEGSKYSLVTFPGGGLIEVGSIGFAGGADLQQGSLSPSFALKLTGGHALLSPNGDDSFVSSLVPAGGLEAQFDLGLRWSAKQGFSFEGSASAAIDIPLHAAAGGVRIDSLHIEALPSATGLGVETSVTCEASIGPVGVSLQRFGVLAAIAAQDGNLGPVDVSLDFKPPSGAGLEVDFPTVTGGGFLFHDASQGLYAGAMQLSLYEQITLKGFGLIATRLPDGSPGYSLIVFITAEDFRPIPLGLGFTLLGVGGLLAVHRTFDQDVLRQDLQTGTLATLLFPRDPIGNAPTLIRSLAGSFPARQGSYLFGVLAKIGWFTPPLVLMDLALILELGARERLLALGHISALLPSADNDLVRLNLEAMGVIDFDAGTAALDAVLVDSRLAHKFPLTGSATLRAGFGAGSNSTFVLSAGGLNPHFTPPAGLPALQRVAIALCAGDNPRLICEAYFAITANTVQFGARASLYAAAAGFSVEGDVGFDVLVQLAPLHFIANFDARLQLKCGSHNLFMVEVKGELEGPRPLRVSGKAHFEILWCDFSVNFDATLIDGEPPPLPLAVDVLGQLTQALVSPASWSTRRTSAQPSGVALRSLPPAGASSPLVLDPLGQLLVTQQVVPLNTGRDIEIFGGAPLAGDRRFGLTAMLNGAPLAGSAVQAPFAPAQFFVMSDDEKLAAPSFESMDAGCVFGSATTVIDLAQVIAAPLEYQTIVIGASPAPVATSSPHGATATAIPAAPGSAAAPTTYTLTAPQLQSFSRSGSAARAPLRRVGRARFRNDLVKAGATLKPKHWTIMPKADGTAATVDPSVRTWSEYQAALKAVNRGGAHWQLLPTYELQP